MKINFDMDINVNNWAEAIGYTVVGDKVVSKNVYPIASAQVVTLISISKLIFI